MGPEGNTATAGLHRRPPHPLRESRAGGENGGAVRGDGKIA